MKEEKNIENIENNKDLESKTSDTKTEDNNSKKNDSEFQMPTIIKFEKNYDNKDLNLFKEDILNYLNERDKSIFAIIKDYKEKMEKTEKNYLDLTRRISNNYSDVLSSQANINNRLDKLNSYESFSIKTNDQLISHEIRLNNLREDYNKSVQKYDKIYLDNLELPGYIGKYAKYKNCQVFFDDVIKELNKLNSYREKNIIDLKAYKDKLELIIKTFNNLVDNNNKSQIKYINEMNEKNNKECKNLIDTLGERLTDMRIENSRYAVELIGKSINLTKEWDKIQQIKEEIMKEFNDKIHEFRIVSNNTVNSFHDFKNEFTLIKRKFFELAEFIKDVRFRKNIGGEVKKKEIKTIAKKITGKKSCCSIDKDKEKFLLEFNFKNDKNEKIDLRQSVSQEPGSKIKDYIKGVTNVEELKQDSKYHDLSCGKIKKKSKKEMNKSCKNINVKDDVMGRRKKKTLTFVSIPSNIKKINTSKNENTENSSDESEKTDHNNSLINIMQNNNNDNTNIDKLCEGMEEKKTNNTNMNIGNNINRNNRYLFKDVHIDTDDKIINELASELEATSNKVTNKPNEKNEKIHTVINKIEPMNINMNINKVENLNVNNNNSNRNRNNKEKKSNQITEKNSSFTRTVYDNSSVLKKMNNFDKKMTNLEVYVKEKIIDLISQIENLRQLFLNTNKLPSFTTSPLFNFPTYNNPNGNNLNQQPNKIKEARIIEIGGKLLPPPTKVSKKYSSNLNNVIIAKDKESFKDINNESNNVNSKVDLTMQKDGPHRIKTGKNPTNIKGMINKTVGGNNNTIIFSNMANDINAKFLKGVEKRSIIDGGIANKNITENKNNINKFIDLNKITTNLAIKTQNNFKNEVNLLAGNNSNLP